ncbi:MAG: glycosyltransferase family 4 protein [Anaerolineae bacterium]|nr:glycosyltransferase family 4 protein [Anaerolineae bacterium]
MTAHRNRVLMLLENCSYPRDTRVRHEAEALAQQGYRVSVVCPNAGGQTRRETIGGVRVYRFPKLPEGNSGSGYVREYLCAAAAIFALSLIVFVREGVDIVHAHNPPDVFFLLAPVIRLWGVRFVYDHHDLAPELYYARFGGGSRLVHDLLLLCEILSCRAADRVIVTNESYRDLAQTRARVAPDRISIVRNGPDETGDSCEEAHSEVVIAYAGSVGFQDGVDHLLRTLRCLISDFGRTDFRCVLMGDGDALATVERLASELDLQGRIEFRGWVQPEEVGEALRRCDICVAPEPRNPYNDRSTMIKVLEYMAAGKPIVAFDLIEHRRSADDAALYAQPNDVRDFARQIAILIDDPALRQRMGDIGRRRIAEEFAWRHQAPHLLEAYAQIT